MGELIMKKVRLGKRKTGYLLSHYCNRVSVVLTLHTLQMLEHLLKINHRYIYEGKISSNRERSVAGVFFSNFFRLYI